MVIKVEVRAVPCRGQKYKAEARTF